MKKAIVIGSTGMVGAQLIQLLTKDEEYTEIISLVRRRSGFLHPKINEFMVNFDEPETWSHLISGDVLFSCMGTTIAKAKTKEVQYKIDFTYQYEVAKAAANKGVSDYVLVSSAGANSRSMTFYMNMKGKLEDAVRSLPFKTISIIRPGQLDGNRIENRPSEKVALWFMYGLNRLGLFRRYRPIQASQVAKAMINAAKTGRSATYTLNEVFTLAH